MNYGSTLDKDMMCGVKGMKRSSVGSRAFGEAGSLRGLHVFV